MADSVVRLGPEYLPDPDRSRSISGAYIYVGLPNTDPETPTNQKTLSVLQEDGSTVSVSQPLRTNAGGIPIYNGSPVTMLVDGEYSLKVLKSDLTQAYYVPDSQDTAVTEFTDSEFRIIDDGTPSKKIAFEASSISSGTTRTATMPDRDIDLGEVATDPTPQLGGDLDTNSNVILESKGSDIASATNLVLGGDGNTYDVTGTTTIETISTTGNVGTLIRLQFDGALTLTHDATKLILPTGQNITTAAGDVAFFEEYASGNWRCMSYERASGKALVEDATTILLETITPVSTQFAEFDSNIDSTYNAYMIRVINAIPDTDSVDFWVRTSADGGTTYDSSGYAWCVGGADENGNYGGNGSTADANIIFNRTGAKIGSDSNEQGISVDIMMYQPSDSVFTIFNWSGNYVRDTGNLQAITGAAKREAAAAVDAIRFNFSAGLIETGIFQLYGLK